MSIRLKPALLAEVEAYAAANGLKMHAAVVALIDLGLAPKIALRPVPADQPLWPSGAPVLPSEPRDPSAVHVDVPVYERKAFNPRPKSGKR